MKLFMVLPVFVLAFLSQAAQAQAETHLGISWEAVILALIAAVPPSLLALAAWRSSKQTGVDVADVKSDVAAVHVEVNSKATKASQELKDTRQEVTNLREYIAEQREGKTPGPLPPQAGPTAP